MKRTCLEIISGTRRGPGAALARVGLGLCTLPYGLAHGLRKLAYRIGLMPSARLPIPVLSVGNLTAGGTGKTPVVEYLARRLASKQLRVVILARGYGAIDGTSRDDEELFAEMDLERVVRLANPNRVESARRALKDFKPDLFLLDDGFQHYRIKRDLDLLVIDATDPFSNGRLLPRGLLREPPRQARHADLILLSRCDQVEPDDLQALRSRLERLAPSVPRVETRHRPTRVRLLSSRSFQPLDWLKDRPAYAFCGIGNPEAFRKTLQSLGADVRQFRVFDDHHRYTPQDLVQINAAAEEFMAEIIMTTEKDITKLAPEAFHLPLGALSVEIEIRRGAEHLDRQLETLIEERPRRCRSAATS